MPRTIFSMSHRASSLAAVIILVFTAAAGAQSDSISETTMCSTIRAIMDDNPDPTETLAISNQVMATLSNADPAFVSRLSDDGRLSAVAVATNLCAMHPDETLKSATYAAGCGGVARLSSCRFEPAAAYTISISAAACLRRRFQARAS